MKVLLITRLDGITSLTAMHDNNNNNNSNNNNSNNNNYYYNGNYNVNNRNSAMDIPRGGSSCPPFPGLMTFAMFVLVEGGKLVDPEKNPRSEEEN